jgi:integrase
MFIVALDTGMRRGEMLALRFADIDFKRRRTVLCGVTTKSGRTRVVPIGTERLLAVLKWLRLDVDGNEKRDQTPVFSDEAGEQIKPFRRAGVLTVLKAHRTTTASVSSGRCEAGGSWRSENRESTRQAPRNGPPEDLGEPP